MDSPPHSVAQDSGGREREREGKEEREKKTRMAWLGSALGFGFEFGLALRPGLAWLGSVLVWPGSGRMTKAKEREKMKSRLFCCAISTK